MCLASRQVEEAAVTGKQVPVWQARWGFEHESCMSPSTGPKAQLLRMKAMGLNDLLYPGYQMYCCG
jgi:hypothetical protein